MSTFRLAKGLNPAVPLVCASGHKFYSEAEAQRICPFCLFAEVSALRARIQQVRATLDMAQTVLMS